MKQFLKLITFTEWYYLKKEYRYCPEDLLNDLKAAQLLSVFAGMFMWACIIGVSATVISML